MNEVQAGINDKRSTLPEYLKTSLPPVELIVYHIVNILSLGTLWVLKILIKKAVSEAIYRTK